MLYIYICYYTFIIYIYVLKVPRVSLDPWDVSYAEDRPGWNVGFLRFGPPCKSQIDGPHWSASAEIERETQQTALAVSSWQEWTPRGGIGFAFGSHGSSWTMWMAGMVQVCSGNVAKCVLPCFTHAPPVDRSWNCSFQTGREDLQIPWSLPSKVDDFLHSPDRVSPSAHKTRRGRTEAGWRM